MPAPVSQLKTIQVGSKSAKELAPAVRDACISLGFLYLTDTGLEDDVEEMFKLSKEFFLGERKEEKDKCARGVRPTVPQVRELADERSRPTTWATSLSEASRSTPRSTPTVTSKSKLNLLARGGMI